MKTLTKHFRNLFLGLVFLECFYVSSAMAQNTVVSTDNVQMPSYSNVILKYSKINDKDRFSFDFPSGSKIAYNLYSDENSTTIVFSRLFRLETLNLTEFANYGQITQKRLSSRQLEIVFPLPLAASVEHLNSVILDLAPKGSVTAKDPKKNIKPLQISSLSFSWNTPVALSVFKRDKYLWIVFNQYQKVDIDELTKNAGNMVKDIIQLPHNSATILRLEATDELYSDVRKEGLLWIVDLYNRQTERNLRPIKVTTDDSLPDKPAIVVDLPHTEDVFSFLDPEIGDMLMAITSSEAGYAFINGYKYPDFEFLPTSQGMAVNSDDFSITIIRNSSNFILQTTQHPLHISQNIEKIKQQAVLSDDKQGVNISQELNTSFIKKTFAESEQYLKEQIKTASTEDKNKFKLELARFYLSYGLGSNAIRLLREIRTDLKIQQKPIPSKLTSLFGVANFVMKRYDLAFDIFSQQEFAENTEISFWKSLSDTDEHRNNSAQLLRDINLFHNYPTAVKKILILRGIEYALEKRSDLLTQKLLNFIKDIPLDEETQAAVNYYEAEKIRLQGYIRSALPQYIAAATGSSARFSALARFQVADFNSKLADVKKHRTIQEFERLRFAWGEKSFKLQVLNRLVELYLETNKFYQALKTLELISNISSKQRPMVEQRMVQIMEELYYYNNDNQFDPIKALALFDDFGYLIDRSPYQTAIVIKLADRLVAVDLLDRAYTLLNTYLNNNRHTLSHQEISAMGSRLALIDMFKGKEPLALEILKETEYPDISETLATQRKIIEAKAYVQLGEPDKALVLLKDNTSRNAIMLKSEIYWNAKQWDKASDMIHLLVEKPEKDKPLSEEQIRYILDWLTALKQAGKETVIVRIRNTFKPYFDKTAYASLFDLLTGTLEDSKISITDINKTIQNVQRFSDFAKQYTKSLVTENISENNDTKQ